MKYKAYVYLSTQILNKEGELAYPCLETCEHHDKESVLAFVKSLFERGIAKGYRMLFKPNMSENSRWYMDSEIEPLNGKVKIVAAL